MYIKKTRKNCYHFVYSLCFSVHMISKILRLFETAIFRNFQTQHVFINIGKIFERDMLSSDADTNIAAKKP